MGRPILLWNEPGDGLSSLRDDNFLAGPNPAQQAGVAVSQVSDGCCFHDAPILAHMAHLSNRLQSSTWHRRFVSQGGKRQRPTSNVEPSTGEEENHGVTENTELGECRISRARDVEALPRSAAGGRGRSVQRRTSNVQQEEERDAGWLPCAFCVSFAAGRRIRHVGRWPRKGA